MSAWFVAKKSGDRSHVRLEIVALITAVAGVGSASMAVAQETATAVRQRNSHLRERAEQAGETRYHLKASDFVVVKEREREVTGVSEARNRSASPSCRHEPFDGTLYTMRHALRSFFKEMEGNADIRCSVRRSFDASRRLHARSGQLEAGSAAVCSSRPAGRTYWIDRRRVARLPHAESRGR